MTTALPLKLCAALLAVLLSGFGLAQPQHYASIDARSVIENNKVSLQGTWQYQWGTWLPLADIANHNHSAQEITLPNYLADLPIPEAADQPNNQGIMTYFVTIKNLPDLFKRPTMAVGDVSEAWQAWWVDEATGTTTFLGQSGRMAKTKAEQEFNNKNYLLMLPNDSQVGTLVFYVSAYHSARTGLYSELNIVEYDQAYTLSLADLASRAFILGIGVFIVIQNLVFFIQRPKEKTLLLIALFALVGLLRAAFASGYVDFFVQLSNFRELSIRLEYLLIIWPAVAGLHMLSAFFPYPRLRYAPLLSYLALGIITVVTFSISLTTMTLNLDKYQLALAFVAALCLLYILRGVSLKLKNSRAFLYSFIPLILAIINDVYASRSASYSFYIAEYAFFFFMFIQTQIQASRFIIALETSEHLTDNLQREVARKTFELQKRNQLLEEKAESLELKHQEVKLLSETDHLTGLYNRQSLESRFEHHFQVARRSHQPLSLVMMDLDHFKDINDKYGHTVGDESLIYVASYLRALSLRKHDLVARYGGEEFVILLNGTDLDTAHKLVQEMCNGLPKHPVTGNHPDLHLTASFGIAELWQSHATTPQMLIERADSALYLAKQNGRNRVEISPAA